MKTLIPKRTLADGGGSRQGNVHCVFRVENDWYSIPAQQVQEVVVAPSLTEIPFCDPALLGLCHLRSAFLPVFSLKTLLEPGSESRWTGAERLLIVESVSPWGVLISETAALNTIETSLGSELTSDDCWMGTSLLDDRFVRVLHTDRLHVKAKKVLEQYWSRCTIESEN